MRLLHIVHTPILVFDNHCVHLQCCMTACGALVRWPMMLLITCTTTVTVFGGKKQQQKLTISPN